MQSHASQPECLDEDEVLAFVEGGLADEDRSAVITHVDGCDSCRALVAALAHEREPTNSEKVRNAEPIESTDLIDSRFRLGVPLGRGAMATVYRAHDERLGIEVALKLLKSTAPNAKALAKELRVGRRITHPNVCRLFDAGTAGDKAYITMELIEGETLAQLLTRGELPWERAAEILDGIASGLAAAHEQGVVHRDLKPANVLMERGSGRAVLTDFGFARDLEAKESRKLLVGTPAYWSPEQARGESATPASDVYSFGVLAYRLFAHRELELSDATVLGDVPKAFRDPIAKCLAMRPSERFKDAREVRIAFREAATRAAKPPLGATTIAFAIAMTITAGLAIGAFVLLRDDPKPIASPAPSSAPATTAPSTEPSSTLTPTSASAATATSSSSPTASSASASAAASAFASPSASAPTALPTATPALPPRPPRRPTPPTTTTPSAAPSAGPPAPAPSTSSDRDLLYVK